MQKINIAIFASGKGTNAAALIRHFKNVEEIGVRLVLTNRAEAKVCEVAGQEGIILLHVPNEELNIPGRLCEIMAQQEIDFIILAGFLRKIPDDLIHQYRERIINIHPALLPKYGGKGMYGRKVHEEVLRNCEKETGISIHYVTEGYDEGDVIFQESFPVEKNDTVETLEKKMHELEHRHFPRVVEEVIKRFIRQRNA